MATMSKPTLAQSAGRAYVLLLQNDTSRALKELSRHELDMVEGEPVLVEVPPLMHPEHAAQEATRCHMCYARRDRCPKHRVE
jgi:hypothetical protein